MARTLPSGIEPHLFIPDDNGISCEMPGCGLPKANARHTGATCAGCTHLLSSHFRRRRWRYCVECHTECKL